MEQKTKEKKAPKRARIEQSDVPKYTLEEALKVPKVIWDQFAGKPTAPLDVAAALGISPSSTNWRYLSGAAVAYGLTSGAYSVSLISLQDIARSIVAPTFEGADRTALTQAALVPNIPKKFYEHYRNAKLPKDEIARNMIISWGIPNDKANEVYELIKANGYYANMFKEITGNVYVQINAEVDTINNADALQNTENEVNEQEDVSTTIPSELLQKMGIDNPTKLPQETKESLLENKKVFISHGKNKEIVKQLRELLTFGTFEPIVSVDRESTAIPVPDKVFKDMSECIAGVIHIEGERNLIDSEGVQCHIINENVLIEIGAAIAYYGKKIILLCQKGINLPSNLQGLYRCEYEGDKLDYEATMKLLKTFNDFRKI